MKWVHYLLPSIDLDCIGCDYAQKATFVLQKGLLHYCVKDRPDREEEEKPIQSKKWALKK